VAAGKGDEDQARVGAARAESPNGGSRAARYPGVLLALRLDQRIERLRAVAGGRAGSGTGHAQFRKRAPPDAARTRLLPLPDIEEDQATPERWAMVGRRMRRFSECLRAIAEIPNPWAEVARLVEDNAALRAVVDVDIEAAKRENEGLERELEEMAREQPDEAEPRRRWPQRDTARTSGRGGAAPGA